MSKKTNTTARVINNSLVLNLEDAKTPTVWRLDLARTHAFGLAIDKSGEIWRLGVQSPQQDFAPVAEFEDKAVAEKALKTASSALLDAPDMGSGEKVTKVTTLGSIISSALVACLVTMLVMLGVMRFIVTPQIVKAQQHSMASVEQSSMAALPKRADEASSPKPEASLPVPAESRFGR